MANDVEIRSERCRGLTMPGKEMVQGNAQLQLLPEWVATCWVYRGGLPGILTCGVGWGGVGCVNVGVHVYTWYAAAGVLMCTHGTWGGVGWGGVGCVNVGVHVYTWYAAGVLMCTHGTWGGVRWGGVGCVNVGVHVYTWYAAGVLMCTHGTLLVCSCVHMVRCWCVDVYTWYAAGVFMCTHGTLLVCHVQTYHAIAVS